MKKLLSMAFCAAAMASFAADEIPLGYEVGVIRIGLTDGQKNTIIAASFTDLASDGNVSIANLVKTTNLEEGAQIIRYNADGTHETWTLNADKTWKAPTTTFTLNENGDETTGTGDDPATTTPTVGEGLWIVRGENPTEGAVIALYGKYVENKAYTTTAGKWNLVGNPTQKPQTIKTGTAGDRIMVSQGATGAMRTYEYGTEGSNTGWYYITSTSEEKTIGGEVFSVAKITKSFVNPSIEAGYGFWYLTKSAVELKWAE